MKKIGKKYYTTRPRPVQDVSNSLHVLAVKARKTKVKQTKVKYTCKECGRIATPYFFKDDKETCKQCYKSKLLDIRRRFRKELYDYMGGV